MYLTVKEYSELMRVSENAVYRACQNGLIPEAKKVGGQWRIWVEKEQL